MLASHRKEKENEAHLSILYDLESVESSYRRGCVAMEEVRVLFDAVMQKHSCAGEQE